MKKLAFCTYDAPLFHGPNTWLKRLLSALDNNEFSITVLVFFEGELNRCETYKYFVEAGHEVYSYPFKSLAEQKIIWILNTLSKNPPNIFVPNMLVHAYYAASWLKTYGVATISIIHSDDDFYRGIVEEFVVGKKEYRTNAVVTCSHYLHFKVKNLLPINTLAKCIPYGVPIHNIPQASFDSGKIKLIYTGRLVERQKRISRVVKAMCKATNEIDGVEGVIIGDGQSRRVRRLIKKNRSDDKVKFGGSVPNEKIFETLSTANVFVLLSDYEGLSQSLLEAMACGLVPVCSDMKSGIPELIVDNETGFIVKDLQGFVKVVEMLKNDSRLCKKISKNAKTKMQHYSTDVCLQRWVSLFEELTEHQKLLTKFEMPANITLPKPHPDLKREDFRPLTPLQSGINQFRNLLRFIFKH